MYLIPIILLCLSFISQNRIVKYLGGALLILMTINQVMLSRSYIEHNLKATKIVSEQLEEMKKGFTTIYLCEFKALRYLFDELGINYKVVDEKSELPCEDSEVLYTCPCEPLFCVEGEW
ncbi:MAG: hypothetical protein ACI9CQ_004679 [Saprospiraceae bacterium]|jgi:hypothetical protein